MESRQHLVLVHGACHGAWCWYRLVHRLRSLDKGLRITTIDLGGCGTDFRSFNEVLSVEDYVQPLMDLLKSLPRDERVALVGHSYGGLPLALAMERFPEKVSVAVFLSALMPSSSSPAGTLVQEMFRRNSEPSLMDCKFDFDDGKHNLATSVMFGPDYMANKLYAGCSLEDLELAKMRIRPMRLFAKEMMAYELTKERYGSVKKVFIVCKEDQVITHDFQQFMIQNSRPDEVRTIEGANHMAMFSDTTDLSLCLKDIAMKYSN